METSFEILITPQQLSQHMHDADWAIFDCRFYLQNPGQGRSEYLQAHIPGAVYVHLEEDLSAPVLPGKTGRHPWPSVDQAVELCSRLGIDANVQVIAYDTAGGALAAARLWWMLRWLGHTRVAVLDGGLQSWIASGFHTESGEIKRATRQFTPKVRPELIVDWQQVEVLRQSSDWLIVDARAPERYRGEVEPIDPIAGHIPGAINVPHPQNLTPSGAFRSAEALRRRYRKWLGKIPPDKVIVYCGSGVTSIHNLLAMLYAGLGEGKLYPGSWSEWIADGTRPIATGEAP